MELNQVQCLQTNHYVGYNRVTNVCTGAITDVPWGTVDWGLAVMGSLAGIFVLFLFAAMARDIVRWR